MKKYNKEDGVWRTIGGRRVFIRTGASLSQAMQESGKFNRKKMTRKEKEAEYELYKKARQDESSIDPMTENSTDWEALDKKYKDRYEDEFNPKVNVKNEKGQWETKRSSEVRAEADRRFNENQEKIKGMTDSLGIPTTEQREKELAEYKKGMADYWQRKANNAPKDADFTRQHAQETADRLRADIPEWMEVGNKSVQDSDGFSTDYTLYLNTKNGKMATVFGDKDLYNVDTGTDMDFDTPEEAWDWFNNYNGFEEENRRELGTIKKTPTKKPSYWDNIKAGKVETAGKSNRKEVSNNIQAHIKDYYDSAEDFVNQMEAMKDPSHPTAWSWGQELARGGSYLIYNSDMDEFLGGLNINPKGKKFNDEQVFNNYTALIGRESAKMYDNIRKDAVKTLSERYSGTIDYLKQTENMSTSEILELLKKMNK